MLLELRLLLCHFKRKAFILVHHKSRYRLKQFWCVRMKWRSFYFCSRKALYTRKQIVLPSLRRREQNMIMNALHQKHIVLADDDQDHAFLFRRILHNLNPGVKLTIVHNGEALLHMLQTVTPDLVFLDLRMPYKNGMECLQEIRNTPHLNALPIVVYSSSSKMTDIQRSYLHQANLYMVKPFHTDHLQQALESVLQMDFKASPHLHHHYYINNRFVPFTAHHM